MYELQTMGRARSLTPCAKSPPNRQRVRRGRARGLAQVPVSEHHHIGWAPGTHCERESERVRVSYGASGKYYGILSLCLRCATEGQAEQSQAEKRVAEVAQQFHMRTDLCVYVCVRQQYMNKCLVGRLRECVCVHVAGIHKYGYLGEMGV